MCRGMLCHQLFGKRVPRHRWVLAVAELDHTGHSATDYSPSLFKDQRSVQGSTPGCVVAVGCFSCFPLLSELSGGPSELLAANLCLYDELVCYARGEEKATR
jgi:hypothetical protein